MAEATYSLKVDLNRNFSFADAGEDISARVMSAHIINGFNSPFDPVCRDSTAEFVLDNYDGLFSPEHAGALAGLDQGKTVAFEMSFGGTQRLFTGWIDRPVVPPDRFGTQTATLKCNSWVTKASGVKGWYCPVQRNKKVDTVLAELIDRSGCYPPGMSSLVWLLGVPGMTELDVATYLSDSTVYLTAETAGVTINNIGRKWNEQTPLLQAISDAVKREGMGRLFLGRDGKLQFWNRDHLFLSTTIAQTYNDSYPPMAMDYEYAPLMFNQANVKWANEKIGAAPEILGVNNTELSLVAGETKTLAYRYADQVNGARVGGQDVLAPVLGTDYKVWTGAGGTGSSVASGLSAGISRDGGGNCEVQFTNSNTFPVYIQAGSQVRGTKIIDGGESIEKSEDGTSIAARGLIPWIHPAVVEGVDFAKSLADFWLGIGKDPRGYVRSITIDARASSAYMTDAKTLGVGSLLSISEVQTGVSSGLYFVIQEEHTITADPYRHFVTYKLEPQFGSKVWLLDVTGYSELDVSTILAPW